MMNNLDKSSIELYTSFCPTIILLLPDGQEMFVEEAWFGLYAPPGALKKTTIELFYAETPDTFYGIACPFEEKSFHLQWVPKQGSTVEQEALFFLGRCLAEKPSQ